MTFSSATLLQHMSIEGAVESAIRNYQKRFCGMISRNGNTARKSILYPDLPTSYSIQVCTYLIGTAIYPPNCQSLASSFDFQFVPTTNCFWNSLKCFNIANLSRMASVFHWFGSQQRSNNPALWKRLFTGMVPSLVFLLIVPLLIRLA